MADIIIIDEKESFREGLKDIFELYFGESFNIIDTDCSDFSFLIKTKREPPVMVITDYIESERIKNYFKILKNQGTKIVLLMLETKQIDCIDIHMFNGFLVKNMKTNELIHILNRILETNEIYVHPAIGYRFYRELVGIS